MARRNNRKNMKTIYAPISIGELLDKISILEIKLVNTNSAEKLANINNELQGLRELWTETNGEIQTLYHDLKAINLKIWDIEDHIRELEKQQRFDQEFIDTARAVYINNDIRATIKKQINTLTDSYIVEEKCYA
jgi:predicted  nucleic acid-binding Zn-ribbon protein